MTDTPDKQLMSDDAEGRVEVVDEKEKRKTLRLRIAREALRWTFGLFLFVLSLAFITMNRYDSLDIFDSVILNIVISGLFGVLTLIIGFVAGSTID